MENLEISIKNKTNLTVQLEKKYNVTYTPKQTFFSKLLFKTNTKSDIYFHQGLVNDETIKLAQDANLTIVNSNMVKKELIQESVNLDENKIQVVYPYIITKYIYDKEIKKEFKKRYEIDKKDKILFFRGRDLNKSGLSVVFDVISRMYESNFTLIIESSSKQISSLKLHLERAKIEFNYILLEDYENIDEVFIASDIFILPTLQKTFATDILKAMYFKNAVFVSDDNPVSEIVDVFSYIQGAQDRSVSFKVDSLLLNKDELKNIQKENHKKVKELTLENSLEIIINLLNK